MNSRDLIMHMLGLLVLHEWVISHKFELVLVSKVLFFFDNLLPVVFFDSIVEVSQILINLDINFADAKLLENHGRDRSKRQSDEQEQADTQERKALVPLDALDIGDDCMSGLHGVSWVGNWETKVAEDLVVAQHPVADQHVDQRGPVEDSKSVSSHSVVKHRRLLVVEEDAETLY